MRAKPMSSQKVKDRIFDIYRADGKLTQEEFDFLKKHVDRNSFIAVYGVWKQNRRNGLYLTFMTYDNFTARRAAFWKSIVNCGERPLTDHEFDEELWNIRFRTRVAVGYDYKDLATLMQEDMKYGIFTPNEIVEKIQETLAKHEHYKPDKE